MNFVVSQESIIEIKIITTNYTNEASVIIPDVCIIKHKKKYLPNLMRLKLIRLNASSHNNLLRWHKNTSESF